MLGEEGSMSSGQLKTFMMGAVISGLVAGSGVAIATTYRMQHASACQIADNTVIGVTFNGPASGSKLVVDEAQGLKFCCASTPPAAQYDRELAFCPVTNDGAAPLRANLQNIWVDGYDGNSAGNVNVAACVTYYSLNGATCAPGAISDYAGTGYFELSVSTNVLVSPDRAWDYPYLALLIPENCNIRGITYSD
jgi:hypothetical protein